MTKVAEKTEKETRKGKRRSIQQKEEAAEEIDNWRGKHSKALKDAETLFEKERSLSSLLMYQHLTTFPLLLY